MVFFPSMYVEFFLPEVFPQGFFLKEMWAHLPLKYRFVLSPLPGLVCVVVVLAFWMLVLSLVLFFVWCLFRALACVLYQFTSICVLLSWRAQVALHQLLCDMRLWGIPCKACGGSTS